MDRITKLSPGERVLGGAGLFLLLDLLLLPWHRISFGVRGVAQATVSRSGVESPNSFLGLLAFLVVAALVAQLVIGEFTQIKLPEIPMSWGRADLLAAYAVAGLLLLKLVMDMDYLGFGAWLALAGGAALVYGGIVRNQEIGDPPPA